MSKRSITESELRTAWAELLAPQQPLIATGRGKTVAEMMALTGEAETTIRRRIRSLIAAGKLRQIGVRASGNRALVYEIAACRNGAGVITPVTSDPNRPKRARAVEATRQSQQYGESLA